jgi:hypothetical protein
MRSIRARQERLIAADLERRRQHKPSPKKVPPPRQRDPVATAAAPHEMVPPEKELPEAMLEMVPPRRRGRPRKAVERGHALITAKTMPEQVAEARGGQSG